MEKLYRNSLRQIDVQDILVFLAVLDLGNTRQVSYELDISRSTVGYCLKRLRTCFSDPLFVRKDSAMTPTSKAVAIAPYLKTVIASVNRCAEPERRLLVRTPRRTVRVCAPEYFELLLLPALGRATINGPTRTALHIERMEGYIPAEQLLAGNLDVACGFSPVGQPLHPDLDKEPLIDDAYVCLTSHRNATAKRLTIDEFCSARHIFPAPWSSPVSVLDGWLKIHERSRTIVMRTTSYQTGINALSSSGLMLALPRRLLSHLRMPEDVRICEPPLGSPNFTLDVIWPRYRDQETRWLRQHLKQSAERLH